MHSLFKKIKYKPQLLMVWQNQKEITLQSLHPKYEVIQYHQSLDNQILDLTKGAKFKFNEDTIDKCKSRLIDNGWIVIRIKKNKTIVASGMLLKSIDESISHPIELSWIVTHPAHQGKGLARHLCTQLMIILRQLNYKSCYLKTHDWRLPAISLYLDLGWEPLANSKEAKVRWKRVHRKLVRVNLFRKMENFFSIPS